EGARGARAQGGEGERGADVEAGGDVDRRAAGAEVQVLHRLGRGGRVADVGQRAAVERDRDGVGNAVGVEGGAVVQDQGAARVDRDAGAGAGEAAAGPAQHHRAAV